MNGHPTDGADGPIPNADGDLDRAGPSSDVRALARQSALAFAAVAALATVDLLSDTGSSGIEPQHVLLEGALLAVALGAIWFLRRAVRRTGREVEALRGAVEAWRSEAERWRRESRGLLEGLGAAMDAQFERWQLSPAEREVALLLVKGLSSNEIAGVRATSERTVRQQSQAVYRKAGLAGRAELAAFFLEDLLLPGSLPVAARGPGGSAR
jgi:DNA-binding CsgD family transcriptional regulator